MNTLIVILVERKHELNLPIANVQTNTSTTYIFTEA